jgi:hypothetical protein
MKAYLYPQEKHIAHQTPASYFYGTFGKLRKATISSVVSVLPSIRLEQIGYHWTDFYGT